MAIKKTGQHLMFDFQIFKNFSMALPRKKQF